MAAMLAKAMGTPQHRNASLGLASKPMQKVASAGCACRNPGCEDTDDGAQHWNLRNTTCRLASRKRLLLEIMGLRHLTQSPAFSNVGLNTIYLLAGRSPCGRRETRGSDATIRTRYPARLASHWTGELKSARRARAQTPLRRHKRVAVPLIPVRRALRQSQLFPA